MVIIFLQPFFSSCFGTDNFIEKQIVVQNNIEKNLSFEENKGQMVGIDNNLVSEVLFKAQSPGLNIWITTKGLTYQFFNIEKPSTVDSIENQMINVKNDHEKEKTIFWKRIDMVLKGASIQKKNIENYDETTQGNVRYYLAHCPDGIFNVKSYSRVLIRNVYPGIDWVLYISGNGKLKHDFIVHPGADPSQIVFIYEGCGNIEISEDEIRFKNDLGEIKEGKLLCHQTNEQNGVEASFKSKNNNILTYIGGNDHETNLLKRNKATDSTLFSYEISIDIGNYNESEDLIIDPELVWGTLYGGNVADGFMGMVTDTNNSLFIAGYSTSLNFPTLDAGSFYQGSIPAPGQQNVIILKFDNAGNRIWATYYGGTGNDGGRSIAIDPYENIWVTGHATVNFPTQNAGTYFQGSNGGIIDLFILKFDNSGNRLWATYYGGNGVDHGNSIYSDSIGNVFLTGFTGSTDFPTQNSGTFYQGVYAGTNGFWGDAFLLKFDNNGNRLWSTYYGGIEDDIGSAITIDLSGNVLVSGTTWSSDFPTQNAGTFYQGVYAGTNGIYGDAFLLKFDNNGNRLWSTFYGGTGSDQGGSIITDLSKNVWVMGSTESVNFPVQNAGGFFQASNSGAYDEYLLKFDSLGNRLWGTLYGGSSFENTSTFDNLAVDQCNNVYAAFTMQSNDMTTLNLGGLCQFYDSTNGGSAIPTSPFDCFITMFDNSTNLLWASYIGGEKKDVRAPLDIAKNGDLFMAGEFVSYSSTSELIMKDPGGGAYFDSIPNGGDDSFISKFTLPLTSSTQSQINAVGCISCDGSATVNVTCGLPPYSFVWSNGIQVIDTFGTLSTISGLCPGPYSVTITSNCNQTEVVNFNIISNIIIPVGNINVSICQGESILLGGSQQTAAGVYIDTIFGGSYLGCDSVLSTVLTVIPLPNIGAIASNTFINIGDSITLFGSGAISYTWNNGVTNNVAFQPQGTNTYTVTGTDQNGCTNTDTITIYVNVPMIIPNVFSPNGDGQNDFFNIYGSPINFIEMKIFNRWGVLLFQTNKLNVGWNGKTDKGAECSDGTYFYIIQIKLNGEVQNYKGSLTLIR